MTRPAALGLADTPCDDISALLQDLADPLRIGQTFQIAGSPWDTVIEH